MFFVFSIVYNVFNDQMTLVFGIVGKHYVSLYCIPNSINTFDICLHAGIGNYAPFIVFDSGRIKADILYFGNASDTDDYGIGCNAFFFFFKGKCTAVFFDFGYHGSVYYLYSPLF